VCKVASIESRIRAVDGIQFEICKSVLLTHNADEEDHEVERSTVLRVRLRVAVVDLATYHRLRRSAGSGAYLGVSDDAAAGRHLARSGTAAQTQLASSLLLPAKHTGRAQKVRLHRPRGRCEVSIDGFR
jgi:hypothetical protein